MNLKTTLVQIGLGLDVLGIIMAFWYSIRKDLDRVYREADRNIITDEPESPAGA